MIIEILNKIVFLNYFIFENNDIITRRMKNKTKIKYINIYYHKLYTKINAVWKIGANYKIMLSSFFYQNF